MVSTTENSYETLIDECGEAIKGIIMKKFRVSLNPADGSYQNQNAIQLYHDILVQLLEKIGRAHEEGDIESIKNIRGYAAVVTYHACAEQRRKEKPEWCSLKNKLRYYLSEKQGFAVWKNQYEEILCGFAGWQNTSHGLLLSEQQEEFLLKKLRQRKSLAQMTARDWEELLEDVFKQTDAPLELDSLVSLLANFFGIQDEPPQSITKDEETTETNQEFDLPSHDLLQDKSLEVREFLIKIWQAIELLKHNQRIAYLLNCTDADGDLQLFVLNGIASIIEIGRRLELTDEQFEILWSEIEFDEALREKAKTLRDYDEKFCFLWIHLPLMDALIAKILGSQRQNVITLRYRAREVLLKKLSEIRR